MMGDGGEQSALGALGSFGRSIGDIILRYVRETRRDRSWR
jgi:hypothetical protein